MMFKELSEANHLIVSIWESEIPYNSHDLVLAFC